MLGRIASALEIEPGQILDFNEELIFNSYHQQGGNANVYIVQEFSDRMSKSYEQTIDALKTENQFLKEQIVLLMELLKKDSNSPNTN